MDQNDNNKPEKDLTAIALGLKKIESDVPIILAKGENYIAEQIITLAKEHNIPITQNSNIIEILDKLLPPTPIPAEAYALVAEILRAIYSYKKED